MDHAEREQEVAQERLQKQEPAGGRGDRGLIRGPAQPVQHGHAANAETYPSEQEHGQHGGQRFGQRYIAAHQGHAQRQAQVGKGAAGGGVH